MAKIELKEPYKSEWKFGYLVTNKEPRRNVILYNSESDRTTISYAKYLITTELGIEIPDGYVVDHINGNKLDDRVDNYQILTVGENNIKRFVQTNTTRKMVDIECGVCGTLFTKYANQTHLVVKSKKSTYCSRRCGGLSGGKKPSRVIREYRENNKNE